MHIKISNGVKDSMPVELFKESPGGTAFFGTFAIIAIWVIVGIINPSWSTPANRDFIPNPSYNASLGEVWGESCGNDGTMRGLECDWINLNEPTIVNPAAREKTWYIFGGIATALYGSSWAYRKYNKLKQRRTSIMRTPNKSLLIEKYINDRVGQEIKLKDIANTLNCTVQTVYLYIRNNPSRFTSVNHGVFKIIAIEETN